MDENLDGVNIDGNVDDEFLANINSILAVKTDYERKEFNYSWIDVIEDALPYLDNILRNPKRFIINEEEIVKVELARNFINKIWNASRFILMNLGDEIPKIDENSLENVDKSELSLVDIATIEGRGRA